MLVHALELLDQIGNSENGVLGRLVQKLVEEADFNIADDSALIKIQAVKLLILVLVANDHANQAGQNGVNGKAAELLVELENECVFVFAKGEHCVVQGKIFRFLAVTLEFLVLVGGIGPPGLNAHFRAEWEFNIEKEIVWTKESVEETRLKIVDAMTAHVLVTV